MYTPVLLPQRDKSSGTNVPLTLFNKFTGIAACPLEKRPNASEGRIVVPSGAPLLLVY